MNPPYFKVRKDSPHAKVMEHIVYGQPNIYAFFLSIVADLLLTHGEMVAITPRSYFNGLYFTKFRKWFFDRMVARQIHLFESRTGAFREEKVLQENVILVAEKEGIPKNVILTTSMGRDLQNLQQSSIVYEKILDHSNNDCLIRVPSNPFEDEIVTLFDGFGQQFRSLGFEISTGPVVTFRATEYLRNQKSSTTAPLLWMHNVRPFITQFPPKNGKPTHIEVSEGSMRLLLPSKRYVLLKRFTSKEEKRRLVAGILQPRDSYSEWVGLENHLNYIYRKEEDLTETEAFGIAAFFNSVLVDRYFRAISGNTQVNATEIRTMSMPDRKILEQIGKAIGTKKDYSGPMVEELIGNALNLPNRLIQQLCELAR